MKYGIRLLSKYTGEQVAVLGSKYATREDARKYFDENCCEKCNYLEIIHVPDGYGWINRHEGFQPIGQPA